MLTFGLRRILNAFWGSPMLVVSRNRLSSRMRGVTGQVTGDPSRESVENSHVKWLSMTSMNDARTCRAYRREDR